jgi:hypothetical protein
MKSWLGVIGRACLEFLIILILIAFAAGASSSLAAPSGGLRILSTNAAEAALKLIPLAAGITLFLAFFSFEYRVKSRIAAWLGLLVLGAMLLSVGLELRRLPIVQEAVAAPAVGRQEPLRLLSAGGAVQSDRVALWVGSYEDGNAVDVVAVDFGSDYPRLAYSPRAPLDANGGLEVQGKVYSAVLSEARSLPLAPEASLFEGAWIWDRLAAMDGQPFYLAAIAAGGFLLLCVGFRFLCRISGWPLANVFIAVAGFGGLVGIDAILSSRAFLESLASAAGRAGLALPESVLLACVEGALGLVFGAVDIAKAPKARRGIDG